jgi:hypothetical protein
MVEKSSENENKVSDVTVTKPSKNGRNHRIACKSGRGEVAW